MRKIVTILSLVVISSAAHATSPELTTQYSGQETGPQTQGHYCLGVEFSRITDYAYNFRVRCDQGPSQKNSKYSLTGLGVSAHAKKKKEQKKQAMLAEIEADGFKAVDSFRSLWVFKRQSAEAGNKRYCVVAKLSKDEDKHFNLDFVTCSEGTGLPAYALNARFAGQILEQNGFRAVSTFTGFQIGPINYAVVKLYESAE